MMSHFDITKSKLVEEVPYRLAQQGNINLEGFGWIDENFKPDELMNAVKLNKSRSDVFDTLELTRELNEMIARMDVETAPQQLNLLNIFEKIVNRLRTEGVNFGYSLVGSIILNVFVQGSDLDAVLIVDEDNEKKIVDLLRGPKFDDLLTNVTISKNDEFSLMILHLKNDDPNKHYTMDFGLRNLNAIRSSNLVATYCSAYPMLQKMIKVLKKWAGKMDLDKKDGISSFFLFLMAIHFCVFDKRCKNFSHDFPTLFDENSEIQSLHPFGFTFKDQKAINSHGIGETLLAMFNYYANFNWLDFIPNTRSFDLVKKISLRSVQGRGFSAENFEPHIIGFEDPLNGRNYTSKPNALSTFKKFVASLIQTQHHFKTGGTFDKLPKVDLATIDKTYEVYKKSLNNVRRGRAQK